MDVFSNLRYNFTNILKDFNNMATPAAALTGDLENYGFDLFDQIEETPKFVYPSPPTQDERIAELAYKTVTYDVGCENILYPQRNNKHANRYSTNLGYEKTPNGIKPNTEERLKITYDNLRRCRLNFFGLSEVTRENFDFLNTALKTAGYGGIFALHTGSFHGVALFYQVNRFDVEQIFIGSFQHLSETHQESKVHTRCHIIADLFDKNIEEMLRVTSCHLFDPRSFTNNYGPDQHVRSLVYDIHNLQMVDPRYLCSFVLGDFNIDQFVVPNEDLPEQKEFVGYEGAPSFAPLVEMGYEMDNDYEPSELMRAKPEEFSGRLINTGRKIDYNFAAALSDGVSFSLTPLLLTHFNNRGSDHKLIATRAEFKYLP